ncbi:hypothetical protein ARMSODRAFT_961786, partial [Armillaria solidipes]
MTKKALTWSRAGQAEIYMQRRQMHAFRNKIAVFTTMVGRCPTWKTSQVISGYQGLDEKPLLEPVRPA